MAELIRTATERQIEYLKSLTYELGTPASESVVSVFGSLSVGDASDKLTALVEQVKRAEIVQGNRVLCIF